MSFIKQILNNLTGIWTIDRKIMDHKYDTNFTINGFCDFKKISTNCSGLEYNENVSFYDRKTNLFIKATQKYIYNYNPNIDAIYKSTEDKHQLYSIDFTSTTHAVGNFVCIEDHYQAEYHFVNDEYFIINYTIIGPYKHSQITTHYLYSS